MKNFKQILAGLVKEESGQDLVEYALVLAMVVAICVSASSSFSGVISTAISNIGAKITAATPAS